MLLSVVSLIAKTLDGSEKSISDLINNTQDEKLMKVVTSIAARLSVLEKELNQVKGNVAVSSSTIIQSTSVKGTHGTYLGLKERTEKFDHVVANIKLGRKDEARKIIDTEINKGDFTYWEKARKLCDD